MKSFFNSFFSILEKEAAYLQTLFIAVFLAALVEMCANFRLLGCSASTIVIHDIMRYLVMFVPAVIVIRTIEYHFKK
jgi:hypothetical protein